jgi:hypothetical protein
MISQHTVGFDPADRLAKDPESVRKRFWAKFKRVAARLPFAEDLLSGPYHAGTSRGGARPVTADRRSLMRF